MYSDIRAWAPVQVILWRLFTVYTIFDTLFQHFQTASNWKFSERFQTLGEALWDEVHIITL